MLYHQATLHFKLPDLGSFVWRSPSDKALAKGLSICCIKVILLPARRYHPSLIQVIKFLSNKTIAYEKLHFAIGSILLLVSHQQRPTRPA